MISGCRTPFHVWAVLVEEFHRSRKPAPLSICSHGQSVISGCRTPVSCLGRSKSKSSTVLGNQHRSPSARTVSRFMISGAAPQVSCSGRSKSKSSTVSETSTAHQSARARVPPFRKPAPLTNLLVHGQSVYDKRRRTPSFMSGPFLVEEFHRFETSTALTNLLCTVTPLTNLLVHGHRFMISGCRTPFQVWAVLVEEFHRSRKPAPLTNLLVHGQSVYDKRLPHPKFHVWAVLSKSSTFSKPAPLTNLLVHGHTAHQSARARSVGDKRLPHPKFHVQGRSKSKSSTVLGNQHRSPICSCTVSRFMISGCRTPSFMSGPFLVEEFHRSRKPAPLTNLLVHGQSIYDKRLPHPKFQVWAVLSRRVPPFSETSTDLQSARARTAHQSVSHAPLTNLLVHGQSVYDKRLPHPKFHVWAVLSRRVPPFSETSTDFNLLVHAPLTNLLVHGQSVYDKAAPKVSCLGRSKSKSSTVLGNQHRSPICSCTVSRLMQAAAPQVSCLGRFKSKSSTVLGNQHRSPICSCTHRSPICFVPVSRFMISGCRTPVSCLGRSKSKSSTVLGNQHRSPICLCTHCHRRHGSRFMISGCRTLFHVWAVLSRRVPPFRKPAPLTNLLVHGQSRISGCRTPVLLGRSKSKSSTVLETSTAHQSARTVSRFMISGSPHPSFIWPFLVEEFHRFAETSTAFHLLVHAPLTICSCTVSRFMISGCRTPSFISRPFCRRVPPFSETSTAHHLLVHGQSAYDKRLPHPVSSLGCSCRRVPPFWKPAPLTNLLVHGQSAYVLA
ncbi:hypothetical protein EVAR_70331_1 [Eumeta japonica]|uniref:Uncharacterized protein n=1 Tax=Eumeta variegata TaxID=151549 RepID=A0A4C1ZZT0_EUMVA|nr:hypothetical protein EVAR_70331_1 [Eumeta japonica]